MQGVFESFSGLPISSTPPRSISSRAKHGQALFERGVLYAPDYVINAGGIISVATEYLARREGGHASVDDVNGLIEQIPGRLAQIWQTSEADGTSPDIVADRMAQELIGR